MGRSARVAMCVVLAGFLAGAAVAAPVRVAGKVESVTLYRGQALVTRVVSVDAAAGEVELVVTDLPAQVVPDSLYAEGAPGIDVRAVRFVSRAVGEEPREEVRKLDAEIELLGQKQERNRRMQEVARRNLAYLDKLDQFVAPTATSDLSKGVLNADALSKVTEMSFARRTELTEQSLKLGDEEKALGRDLSLAQRKRAELTEGTSKTVREATLFLEKRGPGRGEVKLNYLVNDAGWSPAYNFRAEKGRADVGVEYNAVIQQITGENWDGVKLTLSTASPTLSAQPPRLSPFWVGLMEGPQADGDKQLEDQYRNSQFNLRSARSKQQVAQQKTDQRAADWEMNKFAVEGQTLELVAGKDAMRALQAAPAVEDGPSMTYVVATTVSLASRSDRQIVQIADIKLPATTYYVAAPILSSQVYREAELTNDGLEVILGGPASVYLDGRFVGRADIPTVARGQVFVVGLGADSQIRAAREVVDRSERAQGGNRELTLKCSITLENYKDEDVVVRVMDRVPKPEGQADIRITLGEMSDTISVDAVYKRLQEPKGILRWEVKVPAKSFGGKARLLTYAYSLEFDRKFSLMSPMQGPAASPKLRQEFDKMMLEYEAR